MEYKNLSMSKIIKPNYILYSIKHNYIETDDDGNEIKHSDLIAKTRFKDNHVMCWLIVDGKDGDNIYYGYDKALNNITIEETAEFCKQKVFFFYEPEGILYPTTTTTPIVTTTKQKEIYVKLYINDSLVTNIFKYIDISYDSDIVSIQLTEKNIYIKTCYSLNKSGYQCGTIDKKRRSLTCDLNNIYENRISIKCEK